MPKNKIGGNKAKKNKNFIKESKELFFKEDGELYGIITKVFGNSRMEVFCDDLETRICTIKGSMKKRVWMKHLDYVLISLREFSNNQVGDIIHKYDKHEVIKLYNYKELSDEMKKKETYSLNNEDTNENDNNFDNDILFDDNIELDDEEISNI
jgi:translation initiation factor 1A